jgi:nucleoside-diphosphate-sugar epimerase
MAGRICITGASGFVGGYLLRRLAASGRKIVCLGRTKPAVQSGNVEFIAADLLDPESCRRAMKGCDVVIHLAALTGKQSPGEYFRVNREGTRNVVSEAREQGVGRLLYVSTIAVKFQDISRYHYAQSKQQAETIVRESGLDWTIVRPTMIFGPGSAILAGLKRLASLPLIPMFGNGRASVQPIFVEDLAGVLASLLEVSLDRRTIEIGGPEVLSIERLLLRVRGSLGIGRGRVVHLPAGPLAACLGWVEPVLRPLLPVTAGQLASFTNDGTATSDPYLAGWQSGMRDVEKMLQLANRNGST